MGCGFDFFLLTMNIVTERMKNLKIRPKTREGRNNGLSSVGKQLAGKARNETFFISRRHFSDISQKEGFLRLKMRTRYRLPSRCGRTSTTV